MEEDIKILEEYLDKQDRKFVSEYRLMILQAIENLIARYKETKQELDSVKEIYYTQKEIETNYIKKSKIKEKIENIDYRSNCKQERIAMKQILQELLEES